MTRFSGVTVTCNDAPHLAECLSRLAFCDERIVVDLGSTDGSPQIARRCGARVVAHPHVPIVEHVRAFTVQQARHDWIVFLDPDIIFQPHLVGPIRELVDTRPELAIVYIPMRNHFLGRPLFATRWGKLLNHPVVLHRQRVQLDRLVHRGVRPAPGFRGVSLEPGVNEENVMAHFWIDSYRQLVRKHRRYVREEGEARFHTGERFAWTAAVRAVLRGYRECFVTDGGWRCGWRGWFLSGFWAWYTAASWLSLRRYQRRVGAVQTGRASGAWKAGVS